MKLLKSIKEKFSFQSLYFYFFISIILWLFAFRCFLLGKLDLFEDARPYYEHFKFYFDNLSRGIYPLWDPIRQWGVPNEFFLRRIGSFNPFFIKWVLNKTFDRDRYCLVHFIAGYQSHSFFCMPTLSHRYSFPSFAARRRSF